MLILYNINIIGIVDYWSLSHSTMASITVDFFSRTPSSFDPHFPLHLSMQNLYNIIYQNSLLFLIQSILTLMHWRWYTNHSRSQQPFVKKRKTKNTSRTNMVAASDMPSLEELMFFKLHAMSEWLLYIKLLCMPHSSFIHHSTAHANAHILLYTPSVTK